MSETTKTQAVETKCVSSEATDYEEDYEIGESSTTKQVQSVAARVSQRRKTAMSECSSDGSYETALDHFRTKEVTKSKEATSKLKKLPKKGG